MSRIKHSKNRRGLAPLEFVLWLPVLLFIMALMVNYGTMAAWRVRGEVVARDAAWRVRWPRTGDEEPRPPQRFWPEAAEMRVDEDEPYALLDDPEIDHEVVRGPLPNGYEVQPLLDPDDRGAIVGVAEIEREMPLLPRLGKYESGEIRHPILERMWQVAPMSLDNKSRRILRDDGSPLLYQLPEVDGSMSNAYVNAVTDILPLVDGPAFDVMENDYEIYKYREMLGVSVQSFFWSRVRGSINNPYCELDRDEMKENAVDGPFPRMLDTIVMVDDEERVRLGGVTSLPRMLAGAFKSLYEQSIAEMERRIEQLEMQQETIPNEISELNSQMSGADPETIAGLQQQIAALQSQLASIPEQITNYQNEIAIIEPKLEQVDEYFERIGEIESDLRSTTTAK